MVTWVEDAHRCDILVLTLTATPETVEPASPPDIDHWRRWEKLALRIDRLPCITVAALSGPCVRFWMQLALACDHRIATSQTWFQFLGQYLASQNRCLTTMTKKAEGSVP